MTKLDEILAAIETDPRGYRPIFQGHAYENHGQISYVEVVAYTDQLEDAQIIAAQFPKSSGVKAGTLSSCGRIYGRISLIAKLHTDGVNGGKNETGIKRYRTFRRASMTLGYDFEWSTPYSNSVTEETLDASIA